MNRNSPLVGRKIRVGLYPEWSGGEIVGEYNTSPGTVYVQHPDGYATAIFGPDEYELLPANVPTGPAVVWNGLPVTVDPALGEKEWHHITITYNGEKYDVGASAPAAGDCTCTSLLHGHLPECPYPKRA